MMKPKHKSRMQRPLSATQSSCTDRAAHSAIFTAHTGMSHNLIRLEVLTFVGSSPCWRTPTQDGRHSIKHEVQPIPGE